MNGKIDRSGFILILISCLNLLLTTELLSQITFFSDNLTGDHHQEMPDHTDHMAWLDESRVVRKGTETRGPAAPVSVWAKSQDSRVDLGWQQASGENVSGYNIYRSETIEGPYRRLNIQVHPVHVYSDFTGENNQNFYYYITTLNQSHTESIPSDTVSATTFAMTTEELLSSIQEATFRYFYDYGHPVSGLARERKNSADVCASGGTGFGMMAITIGAERGFISRDSAAARILKILRFLQDITPRYHGAWSHWINGATGETIPFSQFDDGGDLVETSYVIQGLLTVRQYFTQQNAVENEIRTRATRLWEEVEWDWYKRAENSNVLYWHWSPNYGWQMDLPIRGYNEAMIVYLLAVASPTHAVSPLLYHIGWARTGVYPYLNGDEFYGYKQWVGPDYGGPLFFTHYSFLGFDPRQKADGYTNYFDNSRHISLINRAYCMDNPLQHTGYDSLNWGLTASDDPWGYLAHAPFQNDNGTITPTAALSAMPYVPEESIATLKHFYYDLGTDLWGEFGFKDAYHPGQNWYADSYIAIDQGPIVVMIENYRSGLCWNLFMSNPEIPQMLEDLGFVSKLEIIDTNKLHNFELYQNFPNPFNPVTTISYTVPQSIMVKLEIFDITGRKICTLVNGRKSAGKHEVKWHGRNQNGEYVASGLYIYRMRAGDFRHTKKIIFLK